MTSDGDYGITTRVKTGFENAVARTREELQREGFGVLTEIDVQATLKKKIGADFRRYLILGACNPVLAHKALNAELEIGLLLPCNVIVYEADGAEVVVSAIDPMTMVGLARQKEVIHQVASDVRDKLRRVIARIAVG